MKWSRFLLCNFKCWNPIIFLWYEQSKSSLRIDKTEHSRPYYQIIFCSVKNVLLIKEVYFILQDFYQKFITYKRILEDFWIILFEWNKHRIYLCSFIPTYIFNLENHATRDSLNPSYLNIWEAVKGGQGTNEMDILTKKRGLHLISFLYLPGVSNLIF